MPYGFCTVPGHGDRALDSICLDESCPQCGIVCLKCTSTSGFHYGHASMSIGQFTDAYKSANADKQQAIDPRVEEQLVAADTELIRLVGQFKQGIDEQLSKITYEVQGHVEHHNRYFKQMKAIDAAATQSLSDVESGKGSPADLQKKIIALTSRVRYISGAQPRLEISPQLSLETQQTLRRTITANQYTINEAARVNDDLLYSLGKLSRILAGQPVDIYNSLSLRRTNQQQQLIFSQPSSIIGGISRRANIRFNGDSLNNQSRQLLSPNLLLPSQQGFYDSSFQIYQQNQHNLFQQQQQLLPVSSSESRSNSLTRNLNKANNDSHQAPIHQSYFGDAQKNTPVYPNHGQYFVSAPSVVQQMSQMTTNQSRAAGLLDFPSAITSMVFVDNDKLASGGEDGCLRLWDRYFERRPLIVLKHHTNEITCVEYQPTSRVLASGSADTTVRIYRPTPTWQCVTTLKGHNQPIGALTFLNERNILTGGADGIVHLWDIDKAVVLKSFAPQIASSIHSMVMINQDESVLAVGTKGRLVVWNINRAVVESDIPDAHEQLITRVITMNFRGKMFLVTASVDAKVRIWKYNQQEESTRVSVIEENGPVNDVVYLQKKEWLVLAVSPWQNGMQEASMPSVIAWDFSRMQRVAGFNVQSFSPATQLLLDEEHKLLYSAHQDGSIQTTKIN